MDGDNVIRALAEALDPASPWINPGLVPAAGWTFQSQTLYVQGARIDLYMDVTRTGSTITMGADGNVGDVPLASGLPAPYRPINVIFADIIRAGSATFFGHFSSTGDMSLTHGPPTAAMATGAVARVRAQWILGLA
jgi:hypothetical protein